MLHNNLRGNRSTGSGEKDFFGVFTKKMGVTVTVTAILVVMFPRYREQTSVPLTVRGSIKNSALIGKAVMEKMFEHCGRRRTTDGRHWYTMSFWLRCAKKQKLKLYNQVKKIDSKA